MPFYCKRCFQLYGGNAVVLAENYFRFSFVQILLANNINTLKHEDLKIKKTRTWKINNGMLKELANLAVDKNTELLLSRTSSQMSKEQILHDISKSKWIKFLVRGIVINAVID
ncbi:Uncharacterized protein Fot_51055 [Forsythia ovata]|uniref:Uncharacterized protein n=1 Tax=Forsythia ovata TaxID=205694 RepID=A0ABD1PUK7_9LAMI